MFEEVRKLNIRRLTNSYGPSETGFSSTMSTLYDHKTQLVKCDIDIGAPTIGMDLRVIKEINNNI